MNYRIAINGFGRIGRNYLRRTAGPPAGGRGVRGRGRQRSVGAGRPGAPAGVRLDVRPAGCRGDRRRDGHRGRRPADRHLPRAGAGAAAILTNNTEDGDVIAFSTKAHDVNYGDSITQHKAELGGSKTSIFKNLLIKDLELQGLYNVTIKSFGTLQLPSPSSPYSKSNYVSLSLPEGFDIQLTLSNDSSAQITLANGTKKTIELGGGRNNSNNKTDDTSDSARIYFHNIQLDQPHGNPVSVLMKRPEILASRECNL